MTYPPTLGPLLTTTLAQSAPPRHRGRPSHRGGLAPRIVAVCAALVVAVTLAVAMGLAASALARPARFSPHLVTTAAADQPLKESGGPTLSGLREAPDAKESGGPTLSGLREAPDAAAAASEKGGFPWGAAAIGSGVALALIGLAVSRDRSRKRTGPAALSH